jgi:hypothetical protein
MNSSGPYVFAHLPIYPMVLILKFNLEDCYVRIWEMIKRGYVWILISCMQFLKRLAIMEPHYPMHLMLNLFKCSVVCVNMLASFLEGFHTSLVC